MNTDNAELTKLDDLGKIALAIPSIEFGRELGRGGMAVVYEGLDRGFSPPRRVAIKLMDAALSTDPSFRSRFEREASVVAQFRHDNIVHVYSCGEAAGIKYIVMEYLSGGTLAEKLALGPIREARAIEIAAMLANALSYSHERGVVHRDFKPANIMFTSDDKPVLCDFGIAKPTTGTDSSLTKHALIIGAPRYMAPEQARGDTVTDRADIYSFGLTLMQVLTGEPPASPAPALRDEEDAKAFRKSLSVFMPSVGRLISDCLRLDPSTRPSASECAQRLARAEKSLSGSKSKRIGSWALGLILCVLAAMGLFYLIPKQVSRFHAATPRTGVPLPPEVPAAALLKKLGIESSSPGGSGTLPPGDLMAALRTNPRKVRLGSSPDEIDAALKMCTGLPDCIPAAYSDEEYRVATLRPFTLDAEPVTVGNFKKFVGDTGYQTGAEKAGYAYRDTDGVLRRQDNGNWRNAVTFARADDDWPVVAVNYDDAAAYCRWRSARLPTEDEWEYAARGPDRNVFPWGNSITPATGRSGRPMPIGAGPTEGLAGMYRDLSGVVWQWVDTAAGPRKILKGGSRLETNPANLRAAARRQEIPTRADEETGFRCAHDSDAWPDADFWFNRH